MARYTPGRGGGGRSLVKQTGAQYHPGAVKSRGASPKVVAKAPAKADVTTKAAPASTTGAAGSQPGDTYAQRAKDEQARNLADKTARDKAAADKLADEKRAAGATPFKDAPTDTGVDTILGAGWDTSVQGLQGNLSGQLEAFGVLEGSLRPNYDWTQGMGPQSVKEAQVFLSGAKGHKANDVLAVTVTPEMLQAAQDAMNGNDATQQQWGKDFMAGYTGIGQSIYMYQGGVLDSARDSELIGLKDNLDQYKFAAEGLIEDYRQERGIMMQNTIQQSYTMQKQESVNQSSERMALIQSNADRDIAAANRAMEEKISAAERELAAQEGAAGRATQKEIADIGVTGRKDVAGIEAKSRKDVATLTGKQRIEQIKAEGKQTIDAIQTKAAGDRQMQQDRISSEEGIHNRQMNTELLKIEKESNAQQQLLSMNHDFDSEMESTKQQFQSLESAKDRALQQQNMMEYRRASMAQEQLQRDTLTLEREGQSLQLLMSVSSNPALLYYMKQSGMLEGVGENLLGEDVNRLIGDLTSSIDPGNLPNIQTYNAMSELQQRIMGTQAGSTRGMSEEAMSEYVRGTAPFTRGQPSQIRIGSDVNPFEELQFGGGQL